MKKVGHAGTLDPFAEGLLIVLVGREETRRQAEFLNMDKVYEATFVLGEERDTDDVMGKVRHLDGGSSFDSRTDRSSLPASEADLRSRTADPAKAGTKLSGAPRAPRDRKPAPSIQDVEKALQKFTGEQEQMPPDYSAKKIKGKKAYELAREGKKVELKPKRVTVYELELLEYNYPELKIRVKVSSGTYIRAIARDIGRDLGIGAYVKELKRTEIGEYKLERAKTLEALRKDHKGGIL